jgi:dienelactone hydrolase
MCPFKRRTPHAGSAFVRSRAAGELHFTLEAIAWRYGRQADRIARKTVDSDPPSSELSPPTSQEWMMAVRADRVEGRKRVNAALATLVSEADKRGIGDGSKKAAVGFCFGGGNVLELARSGADVNAVVCLHGDLQTTMRAKKDDIKAAVFVIHGSKDPVAPKADRDALEGELDGAGANWQMLDFGGRLHSFAEEETMMKGIAEFNAPAAHQTYRMLDDFIQDAFNNKL